ncbi:hypothetical protein EW146_g8446 [Bondarzewia mesenterica]|uniref:ribonuclease Z n=1 Tax=Bondarzewia mesenterica TaxID=1095465 RepID=A0A4V3XDL5_9AGAM|nr:hypothetical protein EW146_g8446 [Bondarzewia mesenterica]
MNWSTSVITTQSSDTEPTVIITFDSAKYIFNTGENSTRAVLQSRRGWKKVKGLFLTQVGTKRTGGLTGMVMSIADSAARKVDVVGPSGILHLIASMRLYTFRSTLSLNSVEVVPKQIEPYTDPAPTFADENITVYSIPIIPTTDEVVDTMPVIEDVPMASEVGLSLKRKRDPSPDAPSKRAPPSEPVEPPSLLDRFRDNSRLDVSSLVGAEAQEWRRLVVDHMFTWTEPPPRLRKFQPKGKKGKQNQQNNDEAVSAPSSLPQVPHWAEEAGVGATASQSRRAKGSFNPAGSYAKLPTFSDPSPGSALAYVVVGPRVRGRFDAERAEELGLQGPLRGRVARGETVSYMVDDGNGGQVERTVRPEDCVGDSECPGIVIVLDVPSPDHVPSLASSFNTPFYSVFRSKAQEDAKKYNVHAIYHLLGDGVLEDERYKAFMNGFADHTHHLVASRQHGNDPLTFTSAGLSQLRLNRLDPEVFSLPKYQVAQKKEPCPYVHSRSLIPSLPANTAYMHANTVVEMRPVRAPILESFFEEQDVFHPVVTNPGPIALPSATRGRFTHAQKFVRDGLAAREGMEPQPGDDLVVLPLGTSSAVASRYRNVSSILVQIPGRGNMLLDAGEGTWGQLVRFFGTDESQIDNVWDVLRNLKCIYISHAHADHHAGLAKILAMRKTLNPAPTEPLYLVALYPIHLYLREQTEVEDLGLSDSPVSTNGVIPILNDVLSAKSRTTYDSGIANQHGWKDPLNSRLAGEALCDFLGLQSLSTVEVKHRTRAFGLIMTSRDGWRIVYSGDTMPCHNLVQAGDGATLLIHEATMGDDQQDMAHQKAHSTVSQAISIGRQYVPFFTFTFHFALTAFVTSTG